MTRGQPPGAALARAHAERTGIRGTVLEPPAMLDGNDRALAVFESAASDLHRLGNVVQPSDCLLLAEWAAAIARAEQLAKVLAADTDFGSESRKRISVELSQALVIAARIGDAYGLLPASRTKWGGQQIKAATLLEALGTNKGGRPAQNGIPE